MAIADGAEGSATATCPAGREAISGGFSGPDTATWMLESRRVAKGSWRTSMLNVANGGGPATYTAYAYCDRSDPGLKTRAKTVTADQTERFGQSARARCSRRRDVLSGGFRIERFVTSPPENSRLGLVHASRRTGRRGWSVTAHAPLGEPALTAYAYCD